MIAAVPGKLRDALSSGDTIMFVSPHLDDAVLSCGAFLEAVASACPVVVVTVFTAAAEPPHTYAARGFLEGCGAGDARTLFETRRQEDLDVLAQLRVRAVHLDFPDALFRRRRLRGGLPARAGRLLPELAHRYPTYRYDIARGRLARGDRPMVAEVGAAVAAVAGATGARLVFCPVGVGRHVDHLIARQAGAQFGERAVYFSDFPYDQSSSVDQRFLSRNGLLPWRWEEGIGAKARLIEGYGSQVGGLFPGGIIPRSPETYYVADR
ncbi:PIG-L family deacetylase [Actinoplanes sp. M2I2]|uniref:PIG-L family deacetylase n=1 Tax=Actinoplanes sp. M2I2 TaxID=1734444 RepID=UPI0020216D67|nr:PIG-L family deacetylase [Actinoplanes sp. M2I2]